MTNSFIVLLAVLWPPLLVVLVFKIFPDFSIKWLLAKVEYQNEIRLSHLKDELGRETMLRVERLKADTQAAYSTLKTSVDVVAGGQSGMQSQVITAVSTLWDATLDLREKFGGIVTFTTVFTSSEIETAIGGSDYAQILAWIETYKNDCWMRKQLQIFNSREIEEARLFCGDKMWLIFYVTRAVYLRLAFLVGRSQTEHRYYNWISDKGIGSLLEEVLPDEVINNSREEHIHGLQSVMAHLEANFLHEATRVMSGSKAISESLSDVHAAMLLRTKQASEGMATL